MRLLWKGEKGGVYDGVVFLYEKHNRYSVHALLGAMDVTDTRIPVVLARLDEIARASQMFDNPLIAMPLHTVFLAENWDRVVRTVRESRGTRVAGGPHATGDPVGTLNIGFDLVFVGDSEESFVDFLHGEMSRGVVYREGDYVFTGWSRVNLDDYPSFPLSLRILSPIEIERGCVHGCRYCETPFIFGRSRYRSMESVREHVEVIRARDKKDVRFIASDSFSYPYFYDLLNLEGVRLFVGSFPSEVRPESVDEEKLEAMEGIVANRRIIVGAQSGSDRMLDIMNRGHTVEDVKVAVDLISNHGFTPEVDFIFGLPGEKREDVEATLELMEYVVARGGKIHTHTFMPLPGTPWESMPAGRVPEEVRKYVSRLIGLGKAYGYWERQERIARIMEQMYKEGKILGFRGWREVKVLM